MSTSTKVIEAARKLFELSYERGSGYVVFRDHFEALDAALKAYDARRAEMSAMQITGGG
jgi:hypothetical protein